jgi:hypothetical protein
VSLKESDINKSHKFLSVHREREGERERERKSMCLEAHQFLRLFDPV